MRRTKTSSRFRQRFSMRCWQCWRQMGVTRMADIWRNAVSVVEFIFYMMKGENDMADMYLALVMAGRRTCNAENKRVKQVPTKYREIVLKDLAALGLDADVNPMG